MAKRAETETPKQTPVLRVPKHGRGALRVGGKNAGSGRPPNEFRFTMRKLASSRKALAALARVIANENHPQWLGALRFAADHGYGKPDSTLKISATAEISHRYAAFARIQHLNAPTLSALANETDKVQLRRRLELAIGLEATTVLFGVYDTTEAATDGDDESVKRIEER